MFGCQQDLSAGDVFVIKVLGKGFDIIEGLAETAGQPQPLRQIAARHGLHSATCANILKTLVSRGYVEQTAPRKGYQLGPAIHALCRRAPYQRDLVAVAEPLMTDLARAVNETVLLAALRQGRRVILCQVESQQAVQVRPQIFIYDNVYETATGRLLLAFLSAPALARTVRGLGERGVAWPQAATAGGLEKALAGIRQRGWLCHATAGGVTGLAAPVRDCRDTVVAALGLFLPSFRCKGAHRRTVTAAVRRTASAISRALARQLQSE